MVQIKNKFQNIIDWWENCVKVTVKHFFHKKGIEESHLKHGLIQYLESKLHKMYRNINESNTLDMKEVNDNIITVIIIIMIIILIIIFLIRIVILLIMMMIIIERFSISRYLESFI